MDCIKCGSSNTNKDGRHKGFQRYRCMNCGKRFDGEVYESDFEYIVHFCTQIKKTDRNKLTRENYCVPSNVLDYREKKNIQIGKRAYEQNIKNLCTIPKCYYIIPNEMFVDEEHYTDEFVELHFRNCMENYDLNMNFFAELDHNDFDKNLKQFVRRNGFKQIDDLAVVSSVSGIYILVLDEYNQVYIGKSFDIKKRILAHWSKRKEFGRLLNGNVETSIMSIDSFGALDTTRIFYKKIGIDKNIDQCEEELVQEFNKEYRLNRVAGGINAEGYTLLRNTRLLTSVQERKLK